METLIYDGSVEEHPKGKDNTRLAGESALFEYLDKDRAKVEMGREGKGHERGYLGTGLQLEARARVVGGRDLF